MCPHKKLQRRQQVMKETIFNKIIDRVKNERLPVNKIILSGFGEPLTDLGFIKRLRAVKELGYPVKFYTNASLLTKTASKQIIKMRLEEINISFNGTTTLEYRRIMGLNFEKTLKNVNDLIAIKKELCSKYPVIRISMILTKENKKSVQKFIKQWRGKVDSVTVSIAHEWGDTQNSRLRQGFGGQAKFKTYPCRSLWHTYSIDVDGNFTICCRDYESRFVLGNIMKDSFADIRKNKRLGEFQKKHLVFSEEKLPIMCRGCNFPFQGGAEWWMLRSID